MLKYLPVGFKLPNHLRSIKYMNVGFSSVEEKANAKFLKLVDDTKGNMSEEFLNRARKFRTQVEGCTLYKTLKTMPKGSLHLTHVNLHPYSLPWYRRPTDTQILSKDDFKYEKTFPNLHDSKVKHDLNARYKFEKHINPKEKDNHILPHVPMANHKLLNRINTNNTASWKNVLYNSCVEALNEGVLNVQAKVFLGNHIDENGHRWSVEEEMEAYVNCIKEVQKIDTDFKFSLLIQARKDWSQEQLEKYYDIVSDVQNKYEDFVIGFEIVEDEQGQRAKEFADLRQSHMGPQNGGDQLKLSLHEGETETEIHDHLIDYLVLKCPNIGHGINMVKHSEAFEGMKRNNVHIEASIERSSPVDNRTMRFIPDVNQHPLRTYLSEKLETPIHNEETGVVDIRFLTWDFFTCAVTMDFDLFDFKKVCKESIKSSDVADDAKHNLEQAWEMRWNKYLKSFIEAEHQI